MKRLLTIAVAFMALGVSQAGTIWLPTPIPPQPPIQLPTAPITAFPTCISGNVTQMAVCAGGLYAVYGSRMSSVVRVTRKPK